MDRKHTVATWLGEPIEAPDHPGDLCLPPGLTDQGLLGVGGMGEVHLVHEREFDRLVALKVMSASAAADADLVGRFRAEAQHMAALDHPAVVPLYRRGILEDGRHWYSMRRVRGATLHEALASRADGLAVWIDHLLRVTQALAHAHSVEIVHRDVTPSNVLIGPFGEVLLLDWGLAMRCGALGGRPMGTPGFGAPEQADPQAAQTAAVDVYGMGRLLHAVTERVGPPDEELQRVVTRCTAAEPANRPTASKLVQTLGDWLHGAQALERARAMWHEAHPLQAESRALEVRAEGLRHQAQQALDAMQVGAPPEPKQPLWDELDAAEVLRVEAEDHRGRWLQAVRAALQVAPGLAEARADLASYHHRCCTEAIARQDRLGETRHRRLLAAYDDGHFARFLRRERVIDLAAEPPAEVMLQVLRPVSRRLQPGPARSLGRTPLSGVEVPAERLLLTLRAPGFATVRLPVDASVPTDREPPPERRGHVHVLPAADEIGDDVSVVPGGWFRSGGDPRAMEGLTARVLWVDAFAMQTHPVTFAAYLQFLDHLWHTAGPDAAWDRAPSPNSDEEGGASVVTRHAGAFAVRPRPDDAPRHPDEPVTMVAWHDAMAYARWRGELDSLPWRLPHDQEWEKAARGSDGRPYPWGVHFEPAWCHSIRTAEVPGCTVVGGYPEDVSVYGVRGLGGNVRDWCSNPFHGSGPPDGTVVSVDQALGDLTYRFARGGAWLCEADLCRSASRFAGLPDRRYPSVGFRLVRTL